MRFKFCIFILLAVFATPSFAEYYLVYPDSCGYGCGYVSEHRHRVKSHKHKYASHVMHRRSSYSIHVYYYYPPCTGCGCGGSCGSAYGVYTNSSGHCVTYDEVMTGYRYRDGAF